MKKIIIKGKLNKNVRQQLLRYIIISLFGYSFVFVGLYILVDIFEIDKSFSFMMIYGVSYILLYGLQLKLLFKKDHNINKLFKFFISMLFFYIWANIFYNIGIWLNLNHFIATLLTIGVLFPFRFFVSKYFVYKDKEHV